MVFAHSAEATPYVPDSSAHPRVHCMLRSIIQYALNMSHEYGIPVMQNTAETVVTFYNIVQAIHISYAVGRGAACRTLHSV